MRRAPSEGARRTQRLVALCGAGALLFNFPLLTLWTGDLFGLPLLPMALFIIWGGLILALALIGDRGPPPADAAGPTEPDGGAP